MGCVVPTKQQWRSCHKGDILKIEELTKLVEKHTDEDGNINYDEVNKDINTNFDALIEKKVSKATESAKAENVEAFVKEQGFENLDQYNAFVKNTKSGANELSEKVTRLESELSSLQNENGTLKAENENYTYMSKLSKVDDKYKKFVLSEVKGLVNDDTDIDTALNTYLTDNAHYLADNETITTKVHKTPGENNFSSDGVLGILETRNNIKLE